MSARLINFECDPVGHRGQDNSEIAWLLWSEGPGCKSQSYICLALWTWANCILSDPRPRRWRRHCLLPELLLGDHIWGRWELAYSELLSSLSWWYGRREDLSPENPEDTGVSRGGRYWGGGQRKSVWNRQSWEAPNCICVFVGAVCRGDKSLK